MILDSVQYSITHIQRTIEDNVLKSCADIVRNCVVVGYLKPHLILLVEASSDAGLGESEGRALKEGIMKRIAEFNDRLMAHERIRGPEAILVTLPGALPRTSVSLHSQNAILD